MEVPLKNRASHRAMSLVRYVLPLGYWATERIKSPIGFFVYCVQTYSFLLAGLVFAGLWSLPALASLGLIWLAYWSIYEIGYIVNDFWSQQREHRVGLHIRKALMDRPSAIILLSAVFVRVVLTASIIALFLPGKLTVIALIAGMAATFQIHNSFLGRGRLITFFLLQILRYLLIVPLKPDFTTVVISILIGLPPSVAATLGYARVKQYVGILSKLPLTTISSSLKVMALWYIADGILLLSMPVRLLYLLSFKMGALTLSLDLIYVALRIARRMLASLAHEESRYHAHTTFSHDGGWTAIDMARKMRITGIDKTFITEHVEDMGYEAYNALVAACAQASRQENVSLVPGIEYSILGQHFLVLGLEEYREVDKNKISSIHELKNHCRCVVWAHPRISLRRLAVSFSYWIHLIRLAMAADGIEWLNLKPERSFRTQLRFTAAYCVGTYLGGSCEAYVGLDAHNAVDWDASEIRLRRLQRMVSRPARVSARVFGPIPAHQVAESRVQA